MRCLLYLLATLLLATAQSQLNAEIGRHVNDTSLRTEHANGTTNQSHASEEKAGKSSWILAVIIALPVFALICALVILARYCKCCRSPVHSADNTRPEE
nr:hypothetical protein HmN_001002600 [Hymenolepis microstoma]CDS35277.2 hypothetical transcript [Hymenolepis microstoma]